MLSEVVLVLVSGLESLTTTLHLGGLGHSW